ncbi:MAG: hypothetical protein CL666_17065 [Balneola sp.]|nr:hypothetical protein [Balneola sp.]|tara:strand:- start:6080 stop:9214 length:3135 start_codon:yes stop_codon:yes gene_type:complete
MKKTIRLLTGTLSVLLLGSMTVLGQINNSDGLRMPGDWNGFSNSNGMGGDFDLTNIESGNERWITTFQFTGTTGSQNFKFASTSFGNDWGNQWAETAFTSTDAFFNVTYTTDGGSANNTISLTNSNWYTVVFDDNGYANTNVIFMETSSEPVTVDNITQSPTSGNVDLNEAVTVTVTTSSEPSAEENIYVRYSEDATFSSSSLSEVTFSSTTGTATIPAKSSATTIYYYVFSTTLDNPSSDYDLVTINLNNNSGNNYSYAVSDYVTTTQSGDWSATNTWASGSVPASGNAVRIEHDVNLNQDATVSDFAISSGATFTASDGSSAYTLTIADGGSITNDGVFASSDGKVNFAGSGMITGTISFNDVDLSSGGVNFGSNSTLTGSFRLFSGASVNTNPPTYDTGSTLVYETGGEYGVNNEWPTVEADAPENVRIVNSDVNFGSSGAGRYINESLTIEENGSLALSTSSGGDLYLKGNWSNAGTFTANNRAVFFVGTGNQEVVNTGGSALIEIPYVIINKGNPSDEIRLNANMEIANSLQIDQGTLVTNNGLTVNSGASFTNSGTITGTFTFQRELTGSAGYRLLSVPFSSITYDSFLDPIWTQGQSDSEANGGDTNEGDSNVFTWDKTSTDDANTNWSGVTDLSGTINAGNGFLVYVYEDDNYSDPDGIVWPKTLSVTGNENSVDTSPDLNTNVDGFTLVGNPFASTIDFDNVEKTDLTNVAYVWDPGTSQWLTYPQQTGLGDLTDGLISPFQGFFVQNNDPAPAPAITFDADSKVTGGDFKGKAQNEQKTFVRLALNGNDLSNSMWLQLSENGSTQEQVAGDALEFEALSANFAKLALQKENTLFDIAHLPFTESSFELPLAIDASAAGTYTLSATDFQIPESHELLFHDYETGASEVINENFSYEIEIDAKSEKAQNVPPLQRLKEVPMLAKSTNSNQYGITVRSKTSVSNEPVNNPQAFTLEQNYPNPFNPTTSIQYSVAKAGDVQLSIYNVMGQQVETLVSGNKSAGSYRVSWNAANMASGIYYYRLQAGNEVITRQMTLIK